jgi:hypothetical protein
VSLQLAPPRTLPVSQTVRMMAAAVIAGLVLFNIALISLSIASVPIRALLAIALLGLLGLLAPELLIRSVVRHVRVLVLAAALASLGIFVSLINGVSLTTIGRLLAEVHLQAMVMLVLATMLAELAGPRAATLAFCAAVGVTALVALVQFTGIEAGWALRKALGDFQGHALAEDSSFLNRRPMGVSYSPIHIATQACLAFAGFAALRLWSERGTAPAARIDWVMLVGLAAMVTVALLCQTRSPILGAVVFVGLYMLSRGSPFYSLLIIAGATAAALAAPIILEMMQSAENRVFRVGDNSSEGRYTLVTYGLMLLADNPLGYGFGFVAQDHWGPYWQDLYMMPSAGEVREAELHNYVLNMLTTYGIGLLLVMPLVVRVLWPARRWLIAFVPYVVHLIFHNTGPFWNDTLFWFVAGAIAVMASDTRVQVLARPVRRGPRLPRSPLPKRAA